MMARLTDLSPRARMILLGAAAAVLVALMFVRPHTTPAKQASPTHTTTGAVVDQQTVTAPAASSNTGTVPLSPLAPSDMAAAAAVATRFTTLYTSFRYDQDQQAWINSMKALLASNSQVDLTGMVPTGAVADRVAAEKRVTTSTAKVTDVTTVMKSSVLFHVTATSVTTTAGGSPKTGDTTYDVVVIRSAGGWGVSDFQPTAPNEG